ncbi:putative E3 ubiquitin ligase complex SCF subunit sconC-like [Cocos nucifera]|uniref:Putative E3 ubiquitin ligase complex SCF subunit sconC-like n=1 Tax=Cocos nucifera TaxID=13894 RepID=A0A8K0IMU9_COCNU|nr:putative E3 ubiquitin ligase complex SCF subunit sconC-like [Cocos nucifera]
MAARPRKMIRLRSVDGKDFVLEAKAAMSSETIKGMMEDGRSPYCIPVAGVKAQTLAKVVEYWTTRPTATSKGDGKGDDGVVRRRELGMWDWEEELAIMDPEALFELDEAARWLLDWPLIELTGRATVIVMEQDVGLTEKRESMSSTSSTMAARAKKMIRLRSVDGKDFVVEAKAAMSSETIKGMMEDGRSPHCIPVAGVKAQTLAKVVEYWTSRPTATSKGDGKGDDGVVRRRELGMWDWEEELAIMDPEALFELDEAARRLLDWPLIELTGRATVMVMEQDVGLTEKRESMASTSSTMAARAKKTIRLRSVDGKDFVVEAKAAMSSETIKGMMEDGRSPHCIPVAGVKAQTLAKVVEYWTTRPTATSKGDGKGDDGVARRELGAWEEKFVNIDPEALFELAKAAQLLEDGPLIELIERASLMEIKY